LFCKRGKSALAQIGFVLPKISAAADIALRVRLSDHVAPQQMDDSAMVARWDVLLLAGVLAGGSMLIETSHRLDTGAPDAEVVAVSTCDAAVAERYDWKPLTRPTGDDADETVSAQAPSGCTPE
jgi:hypothetical protein